MLILGIETSCDETSICILRQKPLIKTNTYSRRVKNIQNPSFVDYINSFEVLESIISSQIKIHQEFGGVVPEIGARAHADQIHYLFNQVLISLQNKLLAGQITMTALDIDKLKVSPLEILSQLDSIFVTSTPGLISALRVGIEFAKSVQFFTQIQFAQTVKLQTVNHLRGHVASSFWVG